MSQSTEQVADFARTLNEQVREQASEGITYSTEVECFAAAVLEMFEEAGVVEQPEVCVRGGVFGRSRWRIAGWAVPPSDDEDLSQLSLLALEFADSPEPIPLSADELRRTFELAVNFVKGMFEGLAEELEPAADAAALGRLIHDRRGRLKKITVLLVTDGLTQRLKEIDSETANGVEIACSIWDIERLSRLSDPKQEEIEVDVPSFLDGRGLPCLQVPEDDPHYDAYLCVVPGILLSQIYDIYGQRLLELNVRAFLSATGKINKGIRETIRTSPERFFPYNNGLSLTARHVEVRRNEDGQEEIIKIVGLQIVNGGQTTASIHRAWKVDEALAEVKQVFVQAKLTVITTDEEDNDGFIELVRSISKFANSQNAVKDDDLEANQPWHVALEKLANVVWTPDARSQWYYERSRGSYATAKAQKGITKARKLEFEARWPRTQLITKTELAKSWNAWGQRPEIVSLGGQKNFRQFMASLDDQIKRPTLDEEEFKRVVAKVILFKDTTRLVTEQKERIGAYRANVTAYLVAYLSFRMTSGLDFDKVWERQSVPEQVKSVLRAWAVPIYDCIIKSAGDRNVSEWCKKADCWIAVRSLSLPVNSELSKFAGGDGVGAQTGIVDVDDAEAISEVLRLTPEEWEEIMNWAMRAENMHWGARGVISTLRSYALANWEHRPSVKQARSAVKSIGRWRLNREQGII